MSKKKATHCTKCGDDFTCGEEYISFRTKDLCWSCYASFHEQELDKIYQATNKVTSQFVCYTLHNYLFGIPITGKYGKDVMTWATNMHPYQLKSLQEAHNEWKTGNSTDLAEVVVEYAQQIAREMNDGNLIRTN